VFVLGKALTELNKTAMAANKIVFFTVKLPLEVGLIA
jgi:hypothetical protein